MSIKHILLAILVAAIWGCNFMFVKIGVQEMPPLLLCAMRFFFASIPVIFFVKLPTNFKIVALYGLIMFGLQFSLMFTSLSVGMTAGMASLLAQSQIFFSIFFAVIFLGENPNFWQIIGGLIAILGILLVGMHLDSNITLAGFVLVISSAVAWGFGNLLIKKLGKINMVALIAWGSLVSCLPLFLVSFAIEGQDKIIYSLQHFSWLGISSLIYIVIASTWLGYGLWNWLLSHHSVTTIVPFTLLIPIFGMMCSVLIMGESFELWKLAASSLVIAGLSINLLGPRLAFRLQKINFKSRY